MEQRMKRLSIQMVYDDGPGTEVGSSLLFDLGEEHLRDRERRVASGWAETRIDAG